MHDCAPLRLREAERLQAPVEVAAQQARDVADEYAEAAVGIERLGHAGLPGINEHAYYKHASAVLQEAFRLGGCALPPQGFPTALAAYEDAATAGGGSAEPGSGTRWRVEVTPKSGLIPARFSRRQADASANRLLTRAATTGAAVRGVLASCVALGFAGPASAHHGFGNFDTKSEVTLKGTIERLEFVNPHAYVYFEAMARRWPAAPFPLRDAQRNRAAPLRLDTGMFKPGEPITIRAPGPLRRALVLRQHGRVRRRHDPRSLRAAHERARPLAPAQARAAARCRPASRT